jgi:hypothetical protein
MASRNAQTWAKRAREQAVKERRDRKREKKAARAAGLEAPQSPGADGEEETPVPETAEPTSPPQE